MANFRGALDQPAELPSLPLRTVPLSCLGRRSERQSNRPSSSAGPAITEGEISEGDQSTSLPAMGNVLYRRDPAEGEGPVALTSTRPMAARLGGCHDGLKPVFSFRCVGVLSRVAGVDIPAQSIGEAQAPFAGPAADALVLPALVHAPLPQLLFVLCPAGARASATAACGSPITAAWPRRVL